MKRGARILFPALLALSACTSPKKTMVQAPPDPHSFANSQQVRATHVDLDLTVHFDKKILDGAATLTVHRRDADAPLVVDTRDLTIHKVEAAPPQGEFVPTKFQLGDRHAIYGAPLTITLPSEATRVRISYSTAPAASGLQWLDAPQTAGKKQPFLFSQSQAIHARSWIPLQDSPGVRTTYRARIRTPQNLIALMSARRDFRLGNPKEAPTGDYTFRMPHAIPSYLIALAVGELDSRYSSSRADVWAEPSVVEKAAKEFEDTERMIQAVEKLYGPYQWLRYDILVLPPSFPFGGMENPLLTFATPTVIAGDKSLVALVAHELAHSWSGNLVTNATWSDFWLNEGFTVYVENRVIEALYGEERAHMEAVLGYQELEDDLKKLPEKDQILHIDLAGRDPDDNVTAIPYEKGALFLRTLEAAFGRPKFDAFLRSYFAHFQFQSITTDAFRAYLKQTLLDTDPEAAAKVPIEDWLTKPGLPAGHLVPVSNAFKPVDSVVAAWKKSDAPGVSTAGWNTQQWLHFLRAFPADVGSAKMAALDRAYHFSASGNSEIAAQWLKMAVRNDYGPASTRLEEFLVNVGRRKFLKPIYEEMVKTPAGRERARGIFAEAAPGYHPISAATVKGIIEGAK
ncbi:MAG: M1 family metallopeptidase [Bryobacteraceae bacterium]